MLANSIVVQVALLPLLHTVVVVVVVVVDSKNADAALPTTASSSLERIVARVRPLLSSATPSRRVDVGVRIPMAPAEAQTPA